LAKRQGIWDNTLPVTWKSIGVHLALLQNFSVHEFSTINYPLWSLSLPLSARSCLSPPRRRNSRRKSLPSSTPRFNLLAPVFEPGNHLRFVFVLPAMHSACGQQVPRRKFTMSAAPAVSTAEFDTQVLESEVLVLVDFWASWCNPCRLIAPAVDAVAAEFAGRAKVLKLDVDENPEIAGRYSVQSIPTLLFFKGGQKVGELVGGQTTRQTIEAALSEHFD